MNKFRPVIGSPVIAESIKEAKILHDDITREVIEKFNKRLPTKYAYVEYIVEKLGKANTSPELIEVLERVMFENQPEKLEYAHEIDVEAPRITDLNITQKGDKIGWKEIFAVCLESIEGNENITEVDWPFLPVLIFEAMFSGERLNPKFQDCTMEDFTEKFNTVFNEKYSHLKGKKVTFQHMNEDTRHNNRVMYAWADKHCLPLVERGISYSETLGQITEPLMESFLTKAFDTVDETKRVMFKEGFEYFLDKKTLYKRRLGESKFTEIRREVENLEEAKSYADVSTGSSLSESVREWWTSLSEYDKIFIQEDRHLPCTDWNSLTSDDIGILVEVYRKG